MGEIVFIKIIGYVVIKISYNRNWFVILEPIEMDIDGNVGLEKYDEEDQYLEILPATEDYVVYGVMPDESWMKLGYYYGGERAYEPDWQELYKEQLEIWKNKKNKDV